MKKSFRFLKTNKGISFVTIFGFAAGLSAALLLLIFIRHELSYDNFWQNGNRVFRMHTILEENSQRHEYPINLRKAYSELPDDVPGIEAAVQIYRTFNPELKIKDKRFRNLQFLYADSTFFKVFQIHPVSGEIQEALKQPNALVINQSTARKIFDNEKALGKIITVSDYSLVNREQLFRVAAVIPDLPKTSHLQFDVLLPMTAVQNLNYFGGLEFYTYYFLKNNAPTDETITQISQKYSDILQTWRKGIGGSFIPSARILALKDIYLYSQTGNELAPGGDLKTIRIFVILTVLILIIAITNFVNIFLVQGNKRSLETGMRKTLGARRLQLIPLFMKESSILTAISFILALFVVSTLVTPFGNLVNRSLSISVIFHSQFFLLTIGLFLLIVLLAGAYPAYHLSKQQPIQVLKGISSTGKPKQRLSKSIVLVQFGICMLLLANLVILQQQFNYMNSRPLGFDTKNVVAYQSLSPALQKAYPLIKNDLLQFPGVESVTGSHSRPGQDASGQGMKRFGTQDNSSVSVREVRVQPDYFKTYGMKLSMGRSFNPERPTDRNAVILNETAARALDLNEPVGSQIVMFSNPMEVIGVVADYHYSSLHQPIGPEIFTYYKDQIFDISIRLQSANSSQLIGQINSVFKKYDSDYVPDYVFLADAYKSMYGGEYRLIQLVQAGSFLAIILTILGMASITAISIQQRKKEIGIRKTIGASSYEIIRLLIGSQIRRLLITITAAGFIAFWTIQQWLNNYAYRIEISFWVFLVTGAFIMLFALIITAAISYRASTTNPVKSLRYE